MMRRLAGTCILGAWVVGSWLASPAEATNIGMCCGYADGFETDEILAANGHIVSILGVGDLSPAGLSGIDALYLDRSGGGIGAAEITAIRDFVSSGHGLITTFSATADLLDPAGLNMFGPATVVDGFFVPSGDVLGGNTVTVVDAASPLTAGLDPTWLSKDPIGVFQVMSPLDPAGISVALRVLGTSLGDIPVAGTGAFGSGRVVAFFTDFADFNPAFLPFEPNEIELLLNAAAFAQEAPEPSSLFLLGSGLAVLLGIGARRQRQG